MKHALLLCGVGLSLLTATGTLRYPSPIHQQTAGMGSVPLAMIADCESLKELEQIVCLSEAFKATLTQDQLTRLQLVYSKTDAAKWSNFPQGATRPPRVGINFGSLTDVQLKAAKKLLTTVLQQAVVNEGYDELEGIWAGDDYYGKTTGNTNLFGAGNYYLAFLGTPSPSGLWELQFGGHHYAFANTYNKGKLTGTTPSFRGVEPMAPVTANGRTYQPMEQERQAFADVWAGLSSGEQTKAKLPVTFQDVLLGPGRDGQFPTTKQGVRVGDLSADKQKVVLKAIKLYVNDLDAVTAAAVLASYTTDVANTYLAYAGSGTMNQTSDYVRIDGPRVWIEYSAQASRSFPGTVHAHSVWRDRVSDYGGN